MIRSADLAYLFIIHQRLKCFKNESFRFQRRAYNGRGEMSLKGKLPGSKQRNRKPTPQVEKESFVEMMAKDGNWIYLAIPVVLLCFLVFMVFMNLRCFWWDETVGTIVHMEVGEEKRYYSRGNSLQTVVYVDYEYTVDGTLYKSRNRTSCFFDGGAPVPNKMGAEDYMAGYQIGQNIPVYYSSSDPCKCCREKALTMTTGVAILILLLLFFECLHQKWPHIFWRPPLGKSP